MPGNFLDTNVLIYLASADVEKANRAEQLVDKGGVVSIQVLKEIANVGRRKLRMSWSEIHEFLATLRALLTVQPLTLDVHDSGLAIAERYGLALYDAMIVAAALHCDCDALWSEDMQHGLVIEDRLRIVNPFAAQR